MLPSGFNEKRVAAYQRQINRIVGTRDGRPLIKLAWAPDEFRWYPHKLGSDPAGYIFPIFCTVRNADGTLSSPDRWVLLQRNEPEQYGPQWEGTRYVRHHGVVWDVKGPCPPERYTELRCHGYHDDDCCPCMGYECDCDIHCWGKYAAPNEFLFDWIRKVAWEALRDPDVQPTEDARFMQTPHEQQALAGRVDSANYKADVEHEDFSNRMLDHYMRNPVSTGLKQTESGLYLIDN